MGSLFRMALLVAAIGCVAGCKNDGKKWNRGLKEIPLPTAPMLEPTASSSPEKAGGTVGEPAPAENKPLPPPNADSPWGN